MNYPSIKRL